jgi:hypothetical protein
LEMEFEMSEFQSVEKMYRAMFGSVEVVDNG